MQSMITIEGINVDLNAPASALKTNWALFTVEFEYDCKMLVCHTLNGPVLSGIKKLVAQVLKGKTADLELRRALAASRYITVDILKSLAGEDMPEGEKEDILLKEKYKLIKRHNTYYPHGYNMLTGKLTGKKEHECARALYAELAKEINAQLLHGPAALNTRRGRPGKTVHKYNAVTGLYLATYGSVKEAAAATNTSPSNISACCNDKLGKKTTGGFKWSYERNIEFIN